MAQAAEQGAQERDAAPAAAPSPAQAAARYLDAWEAFARDWLRDGGAR